MILIHRYDPPKTPEAFKRLGGQIRSTEEKFNVSATSISATETDFFVMYIRYND